MEGDIFRGAPGAADVPMAEKLRLWSNHGFVLVYLASIPDATIRELADALEISERRVASILRHLENAELLFATRVGRRKRYEINPEGKFIHPMLRHIRLMDVLPNLKLRRDQDVI